MADIERPTLRERNKLNTMREAQRVAVALFVSRGFDKVTVAEIAADVGIAPITIYRYFGTKERLVIWDEHGPEIDRAIHELLQVLDPISAIREAFLTTLAPRYDDGRQLLYLQMTYRNPTILAALSMDYRNLAKLLAEHIHDTNPDLTSHQSLALAGSAMSALDAALDAWQSGDGAEPLHALLDDAFGVLSSHWSQSAQTAAQQRTGRPK